MYYELSEFANQHGLEVAESTDSYNGYPSNLKYCLFGFEDIQEADELRDRLQRILDSEFEDVSVEVYSFKQRNGWHLWQRLNPAYQMFDIESMLYEDDSAYPILTFKNTDVDSFIAERNVIFEDDYYYIEQALQSAGVDEETYRENTRKMASVIANLKDGEILLYSRRDWDGYYEITQIKTMSYSEDSCNYAIGLLIY